MVDSQILHYIMYAKLQVRIKIYDLQNVTILYTDKLQFYLSITLQQPQKITKGYMLGQHASLINSNSKSQSSIRHQVRKLRAKVKALIPQQMCTHYQKRNQQMQKISQRRSQYFNHHHIVQHTQSNNNIQQNNKIKKQRWKYGSQNLQQWHINNTTNKINDGNKNYQFDKLKSEQIQQINQDKIYYLGQANVQSYNNYLKYLKNKGLEHIQSRSELKTNFGGNQNVIKIQDVNMRQTYSVSLLERKQNQKNIKNKLTNPPKIFYNNIISQSNSTIFKVSKSRVKRNSTTSINKWNNDGHLPSQHGINQILQQKQLKNLKNSKHKQLQKRKQQVQHQQKQKRLYQKLKIDMQMAKADANQRQIKYKQYSKIKQNRDKQKIKQQQVIKRKNILLKKGEIIKINQQLRNIMLQRRNNNQNFGRSNSCIINYQAIKQSY